jgi:hypothetical protein
MIGIVAWLELLLAREPALLRHSFSLGVLMPLGVEILMNIVEGRLILALSMLHEIHLLGHLLVMLVYLGSAEYVFVFEGEHTLLF